MILILEFIYDFIIYKLYNLKMFSCFCSKKQPLRDYYIEERVYELEKILIDNNRLKLVYDGKIVVESDGLVNS